MNCSPSFRNPRRSWECEEKVRRGFREVAEPTSRRCNADTGITRKHIQATIHRPPLAFQWWKVRSSAFADGIELVAICPRSSAPSRCCLFSRYRTHALLTGARSRTSWGASAGGDIFGFDREPPGCEAGQHDPTATSTDRRQDAGDRRNESSHPERSTAHLPFARRAWKSAPYSRDLRGSWAHWLALTGLFEKYYPVKCRYPKSNGTGWDIFDRERAANNNDGDNNDDNRCSA